MTKIGLKTKITGIVSVLKKDGKIHLAKCIEENWNKTAFEYSKQLNFWRPKKAMESELESAFAAELERLEFDAMSKEEILFSLKKRRILQTAPHLGLTEGPRMLCINWLGSLGVPEKEFYVVGMFSGIPFSNRSRPGRINRKKEAINLFPSTMQDALVYRAKIPPKIEEKLNTLPVKLTKFLPQAVPGASYTKWALQACQHTERRILNKNNLVYIDINEVVANYLVQVLRNSAHVFHKIFFDPKIRKQFMSVFPREIMFYTPVLNGKYEDMENMFFGDEGSQSLKGKNKEISLGNPEILIEEIQSGWVCPSLLLTFIALSFLNQFKCFGSFAQVEYLPVYQEKLARLPFMKIFKIESIMTSNLTTGVFPDGIDTFPADLIIHGENLKQKENWLFGELLLPIRSSLIGSYFTGDQRQNGNK
ncbi:MAG: hypothetical protein UV43_C0023G0006 [Parcubacteria group bacterium GW2011_GWF2_42_7]|nr:MAG: hypothetical protein UU01_C0012G0005 [Parcubacteria group bacterium GW2011_GWA2_40_37]KKS72016.1 MAG: hypothetical protein UV43_C0023G0006 [Parcubacteria group bacterium GW2011_GWF2_42_7]